MLDNSTSGYRVNIESDDMTVSTNIPSAEVLRSIANTIHRPAMLQQEAKLHTEFNRVKLSPGSLRIRDTPNAGGNSVLSETLSFEILRRCFGAELLQTEMEVKYKDKDSKKTDYLISAFNQIMGVSVTRAMHFRNPALFTERDAHKLLSKKLEGIAQSSQNLDLSDIPTDKGPFTRQILHVCAQTAGVARLVKTAYRKLKSAIKQNTIVIITVMENAEWLFFERSGDVGKLLAAETTATTTTNTTTTQE